MKRERYKGFVIEAGRCELQDNLGLSALLLIEKHHGTGVTVKEIPLKGVFKTEDEAIEFSMAQGRKIIDGGLSI